MAMSSSDPLAVAYALPGPVPLRIFLDASIGHGPSLAAIQDARDAVTEFEGFLNEHFEDRGELDALLGTLLHDARRRSESAAKQAMFRGAVGIKGVSCEVSVVSFLIHPSQTRPGWCDTAMLGGMIGLRRLRPQVPVEYTSELTSDRVGTPIALGEREPVDPAASGTEPLLRQFCSPEQLPVEAIFGRERVTYRLTGDGIGRNSAVNLMLSEFYPSNHPMVRVADHATRRWVYATIEQPSRRLVLDMFVHRNVWARHRPRLEMYDTSIHGLSDPAIPDHAGRRLDLAEVIEELGQGLACARHKSLPRYTDALDHVAAKRGWNAGDFTAYRCEILYPMYGSQVCMVFDLSNE